MKYWLSGMVFGLSLLCATSALWAVGKGPCAADIEKFCHDVKPGKGRYRVCLKQHESELSDACKEHLSRLVPRKGPCAADVEKFCRDVKPGKGRYRVCLKQHEKELSEACRQHLVRLDQRLRRHNRQ